MIHVLRYSSDPESPGRFRVDCSCPWYCRDCIDVEEAERFGAYHTKQMRESDARAGWTHKPMGVAVLVQTLRKQLEIEAQVADALAALLTPTGHGDERWTVQWIRNEKSHELEVSLSAPDRASRFHVATSEILDEIKAALGCDRLSARGVSDPFEPGHVAMRFLATWKLPGA
jgi:hypothetical protein